MLRLALRLLYLIVSASTDLSSSSDPLGLGTTPPVQPDLGSKWDPLG
jgi:hypothetical protein